MHFNSSIEKIDSRRVVWRRALQIAIAAGSTAALSGCMGLSWVQSTGSGVKGSGVQASETRTVSGFQAIEADTAANIDVKVGGSYSLSIEGDDNLLKLITTKVEGDKLKIKSEKSFNPTKRIAIHITTPKLNDFSLDGAGNVSLKGLDSGRLHLSLDGAGNIDAQGKVSDLRVQLDGAGNARMFDLRAENVDATLSGAGNLDLYASKSLKARVDGVGNIHYKGNPATKSTHVDGVGSIRGE